MIAHIVFFEPKSDISVEERRTFVEAIRRAVQEIPQIQRALIGKTLLFGLIPEQSGHLTYKYAAVFEFADRDALKLYLEHPDHTEIGRLFWQLGASMAVADVELVDPMNSDTDAILA